MTRLLFAILSLTIIAQSALAQFAADSGKELLLERRRAQQGR